MSGGRAAGAASRVRFHLNRHASRDAYRAGEARVISLAAATRALDELKSWPGYGPSPLHELPDMARQLGVGSIACKDESRRFGLGSFKSLGGAYAAELALRRRSPTLAPPTLCCATDGNHGQSVAHAARRRSCRCVIFVHEHAPAAKISAMQALGAAVVRVPGNYDDSVRHAQRISAENGWLLISDTSEIESDPAVAEVMQGYGVMVLEILAQWRGLALPTHVFVQAGVGGLAAAIAGCFADLAAADRPCVVVVEPEAAACVMQAALDGRPGSLPGDLATNMAMLSCGQVSAPAWSILSTRADAFMTVSDAQADAAAARLLHGDCAACFDRGLTPSSAAGLAGLAAAAEDAGIASMLGLEAASRVLIFATEGGDLRPASAS